MFWKKLTAANNNPSPTSPNIPPNVGNPMIGSLQKKFSKGVNYNMKIIIKGDRNVGKSCLFTRLQGGQFIEKYEPTEEIQVTSIQWSFKATEDIVKVEVWDVVDKGKPRIKQSGLKLTTNSLPEEIPALDATFLDVYKGTHGVILVMDVTKSWTYDYVINHLPKIPSEIPILILGNHCDMSHHRCISQHQVQDLIESFSKDRETEIMYSESSMRNGFGLKLLHKFLGLPFLRLQKETFLALIERNKRDTDICSLELNEYLKSEDADYNYYLSRLSDKRRQIADSNSQSNSLTPGQKSLTSPESFRCPKSIIVGGGKPIVIPGQINITQQNTKDKKLSLNLNSSSAQKNSLNKTSNTVSNILNQSSPLVNQQSSKGDKNILSVDEFCPDENFLDKSFLDELPPNNNNSYNCETNYNDSDSDDTSNPMVAKFYEEDDESEEIYSEKQAKDMGSSNKVNPLSKNKSNDFIAKSTNNRKISISSEDIPNVFNSSNNGNISDCWVPDQQRHSPEGGEDTSPLTITADNSKVITNNYEDNKLKKKKEKKDKDKSKNERREKKKKRKSKTENDLEDFLNGKEDPIKTEDYEAF